VYDLIVTVLGADDGCMKSRGNLLIATALAGAVLFVPRSGVEAEPAVRPSEAGNGRVTMAPYKGPAALERVADRLTSVAWKHGWSVSEMRRTFRTDPTVALDRSDAIFYEEPAPEEAPPTALTDTNPVTYDATQVFQLHSLPGASRVLYLDFDGHTTSGTLWNNGASIVSGAFDTDANPASWSSSERSIIATVWRMVADDYAPYQIDVTTQDPGVEGLRRTDSGDTTYGIRVVVSPSNWYSTSAGGVAYVGSFSWNSDTPAFVFSRDLSNSAKNIAEASSHEAGHTVGLRHDGYGTQSYHLGDKGWAPIMGVGYYQDLVQWSRGEYTGATNTEDDLTIISGHAPFRVDEAGDTPVAAAVLSLPAVTEGVLARVDDVDHYSFTTTGGAVTITAQPAADSPNLDLQLRLMTGSGAVLATVDPAGVGVPTLATDLASGTYVVALDGVGNPLVPYSDYGSLGYYRLTITGTAGSTSTTTTTTTTAPSSTTTTTTTAPSSTTTTTTTTVAPTTTTLPPGVVSVRIASVRLRSGTTANTATADVTLAASDGSMVAGATVTGTWSGQAKGTTSAVTNAASVATMPDQRMRRAGNVTFSVRSVTLPAGYLWDGVQTSATARI
jgi:hypothetical protein